MATDLTPDTEDAAYIRPFIDWLREQAKGTTQDELSEGLHDLIARVQDTGKKGSLSLTITVAPLKGDNHVLVVSDEIKLRLPEHDRQSSLFYPDKHGNLSRKDPGQLEFEGIRGLETADTTTGEIKEKNA